VHQSDESNRPGAIMPLIDWSDRYSVGHPAMDHDHRMLVRIVNRLHQARLAEEDPAVVAETISALRRYVEDHFAREERLMAEVAYPGLDEHGQAHRRIEDTVRDYEVLAAAAPDGLDTGRLLDFLKDWLLNHILKTDRAYSAYLDKLSPGAAIDPLSRAG
jgi:hemerythrin-like metal-binding protein